MFNYPRSHNINMLFMVVALRWPWNYLPSTCAHVVAKYNLATLTSLMILATNLHFNSRQLPMFTGLAGIAPAMDSAMDPSFTLLRILT
jgi:hypothetical protein